MSRPVGDLNRFRLLLAVGIDHFIDIFIGDFGDLKLDFHVLVIRHGDRRQNFDIGGDADIRALFGIDLHHRRVAQRAQFVVLDALVDAVGYQLGEHFLFDLGTEFLFHDGGRYLAGAESGHLDLAAQLLIVRLDLGLVIAQRNLDLQLAVAGVDLLDFTFHKYLF